MTSDFITVSKSELNYILSQSQLENNDEVQDCLENLLNYGSIKGKKNRAQVGMEHVREDENMSECDSFKPDKVDGCEHLNVEIYSAGTVRYCRLRGGDIYAFKDCPLRPRYSGEVGSKEEKA